MNSCKPPIQSQPTNEYNNNTLYSLEKLNIDDEITALRNIIDESPFSSIKFEKNDYLLMFGLGLISATLSSAGGKIKANFSEGVGYAVNSLKQNINVNIDKIATTTISGIKNQQDPLIRELLNLFYKNIPDSFTNNLLNVSKGIGIVGLLTWIFSKSSKIWGFNVPGMEPFVRNITEETKNTVNGYFELSDKLMKDPELASTVNQSIASGITNLLSVGMAELGIRIYLYLKYKDSGHSSQAIDAKKKKMLIIIHGINSIVSSGTAYFTSNPFCINYIAIFRVIKLAVEIIKESGVRNNNMQKSLYASNLITSYQTIKTLIIFDQYLYYSNQAFAEIDDSLQKIALRNARLKINNQRLIDMKNSKKINPTNT